MADYLQFVKRGIIGWTFRIMQQQFGATLDEVASWTGLTPYDVYRWTKNARSETLNLPSDGAMRAIGALGDLTFLMAKNVNPNYYREWFAVDPIPAFGNHSLSDALSMGYDPVVVADLVRWALGGGAHTEVILGRNKDDLSTIPLLERVDDDGDISVGYEVHLHMRQMLAQQQQGMHTLEIP